MTDFADLLKGVKATTAVIGKVERLARDRERMRDLAEQTRTSLTAIPGIAEVAP